MAVVNGYCEITDLRSHLADGSTKLDTASLERAINAASRAIDRHCGRRFWLDADVATRTYAVPSADAAYVDDIGSRTGLVVKIGTDGATFPTTLTADTDFILEPRNADRFATDAFGAFAFWQIRPVIGGLGLYVDPSTPTLQVTAKFGWSAIPDEVAEACVLKAASLFKRKDAPFGVAGFGEFGAVRISRQDIDVVDLLSGYRVPVS
jgi:hypothetical protein